MGVIKRGVALVLFLSLLRSSPTRIALRQGVCRDNCSSQRELCVSAVKFLRKINHRRAAEFAEGTQSCFPDRIP